jgi:hypothetical protein
MILRCPFRLPQAEILFDLVMRAEIGVDHRIPLVERHLVERAILGDAGIVDEHLDRPELGLDLLDTRGAGIE